MHTGGVIGVVVVVVIGAVVIKVISATGAGGPDFVGFIVCFGARCQV